MLDVQKALAIGSRPLPLLCQTGLTTAWCFTTTEPRMPNRSGETHRKTCGFTELLLVLFDDFLGFNGALVGFNGDFVTLGVHYTG